MMPLIESCFRTGPPLLLWSVGSLFVVLLISTIIHRALKLTKPDRDWSEIGDRIWSWWIIAIVFALILLTHLPFPLWILGLISFLALKEYLSLIPTRRADRRVLFWVYLTIPFQYLLVHVEWYGFFIVFIPVFAFLLIPLRMIIIGQTEGHLKAIGTLHWGLMTMVFSLSHLAFLLILKLPSASDPDIMQIVGPGLVFFLVVLTQLNDVLQFLWGKSLGKRKILPQVSPGKIWAGFLGGVTTTIGLATLIGPLLTPLTSLQSSIAGAIIGVGGFIGDVSISALKRDLNIKDTGTLLPGHGGILDRLDSLTYTAPLFFHYVYWLYPFHTFGR